MPKVIEALAEQGVARRSFGARDREARARQEGASQRRRARRARRAPRCAISKSASRASSARASRSPTTGGKGEIAISYGSLDELDRILDPDALADESFGGYFLALCGALAGGVGLVFAFLPSSALGGGGGGGFELFDGLGAVAGGEQGFAEVVVRRGELGVEL